MVDAKAKMVDAKPVVIGISGASGAVLARETVNELLRREVPTIAVERNARFASRIVLPSKIVRPEN